MLNTSLQRTGEDGDVIVADILAGFQNADAVTVQRSRARAIGLAVKRAGAGDIILIAGKGHEPCLRSSFCPQILQCKQAHDHVKRIRHIKRFVE